jgi:hypothetical protein
MTREDRLAAILATAAEARAIIAEAEKKLRALDGDPDIGPSGCATDLAATVHDECCVWDDATITERFWQANDAWEEACAKADWRRDNAI